MNKLIAFPVQGGGTVVVEVDEPASESGVGPAARPGEIAETAAETLQSALARIGPAITAIVDQMKDAAKSPEEIAVEFAIKLTGKLGAVIASTEAEANFRVTVTWKKVQ